MQTLNTIEEIESFIKTNPASLLYVSAPNCNVCDVLKEKVKKEFSNRFPKIKMAEVDSSKVPQVSSKFNIFSAPTFLIFFDGKEFAREGRNVSLTLLSRKMEKIYDLYFG